MEKIIIVWEKEVLSRMDIIKSIIALNTVGILIIDPKDKDYEEIIKEAHNNSDLILNEPIPEKLKSDVKYNKLNIVFQINLKIYFTFSIILNLALLAVLLASTSL